MPGTITNAMSADDEQHWLRVYPSSVPYGDEIRTIIEDIDTVLANTGMLSSLAQMIRDNKGSNDLPYHNLHHTLCVVRNCIDGAQHMNFTGADTITVIMAAMYHDFGHSGGREDDHWNVTHAIQALNQAFRGRFEGLSHVILQTAEDAVSCTEYPFKRRPKNQVEAVLRDADLMQSLEENWTAQVLKGLCMEVQIRRPEVTVDQWLEWQAGFLRTIEFFTPWAEEKRPLINGRVAEVEDIIRARSQAA